MRNFDDNFLDFMDSIEEETQEVQEIQEDKYTIKFKYRGNKRIRFSDIPEGLLKVLAVGTGIYEYHSTIELPDKLVSIYGLQRV